MVCLLSAPAPHPTPHTALGLRCISAEEIGHIPFKEWGKPSGGESLCLIVIVHPHYISCDLSGKVSKRTCELTGAASPRLLWQGQTLSVLSLWDTYT